MSALPAPPPALEKVVPPKLMLVGDALPPATAPAPLAEQPAPIDQKPLPAALVNATPSTIAVDLAKPGSDTTVYWYGQPNGRNYWLKSFSNRASATSSICFENEDDDYGIATISCTSTRLQTYAKTNWYSDSDYTISSVKKYWHNYMCNTAASATTTATAYVNWGNDYTVETATDYGWHVNDRRIDPAAEIREIIKANMAPAVHTGSRRIMQHAEDVREMRARETLRVVLGEDSYQRFLRRGFVSVAAKSGRTYTIYRGHTLTGVYEKGQLIQRLCVDLEGGFAPTDSLLARYFMILHDEKGFLKKCNVTDMRNRQKEKTLVLAVPAEGPSLAERFALLKGSVSRPIENQSRNFAARNRAGWIARAS